MSKVVLKEKGKVKLSRNNLVIETVRDLESVEWFANRLDRLGQNYILIKDRDGTIQEDNNKKSAVIYRLYSDYQFFS